MGLLDSVLKKGPKVGKLVKGVYSLDYKFHPFRLNANKNESVTLTLTIINESAKDLLTSVIVSLPEGLGFDNSAIAKSKEFRIGMMAPNETKEFKIEIYGNYRTSPKTYNIAVECVSNYRDYGYEMEKIKKIINLRAV